MNSRKIFGSIIFIFFCSVTFSLYGYNIDLPMFYKPPVCPQLSPDKIGKTMGTFQARYKYASASKGFDTRGDKCTLFDIYGPIDLLYLGRNLDNPGDRTRGYWGKIGELAPAGTGYLGGLDRSVAADNVGTKDGLVSCHGHMSTHEIDLLYTQQLFYGFFAQAYIPLKSVSLTKINFENLGKSVIGPAGHTVNIDNLISEDLNTILEECGIEKYSASHKRSGVGDLVCSVGWAGAGQNQSELVKNLSGFVSAGVIFPMAKKYNEKNIFDVPLGYITSIGFMARAQGDMTIFTPWLGIGVYGGGTVFLSKDRYVPVKTDEKQAGWFTLGRCYASVDTGSLWDIGCYARLGYRNGGSLLVGYTYASQEHTSLTVRDNNFLETYVKTQKDLNKSVNINNLVNSDERLRGWKAQMLHCALIYKGQAGENSTVEPMVSIEYSYPITGKYLFYAPMLAGTLGFSVNLNF